MILLLTFLMATLAFLTHHLRCHSTTLSPPTPPAPPTPPLAESAQEPTAASSSPSSCTAAAICTSSRPARLLYLFSGAKHDADMSVIGNSMNVEVEMIDGRIDEKFDLLDDIFVDRLIISIRAHRYDGVIMAPPCSTFSAARGQQDGPPPLRGHDDVTIYGLPNLHHDDKKRVREATSLALRCLQVA